MGRNVGCGADDRLNAAAANTPHRTRTRATPRTCGGDHDEHASRNNPILASNPIVAGCRARKQGLMTPFERRAGSGSCCLSEGRLRWVDPDRDGRTHTSAAGTFRFSRGRRPARRATPRTARSRAGTRRARYRISSSRLRRAHRTGRCWSPNTHTTLGRRARCRESRSLTPAILPHAQSHPNPHGGTRRLAAEAARMGCMGRGI